MSTLAPERQTTASQAPVIVHGSNADIYQLWLERTGQAKPDDLSANYAVQHGKHLEPFVLDWIERTTQQEITERQRFVQHPTVPYLGATLDGYRAFDDAVIEVKVLSPFNKAETVGIEKGFLDYYAPQVAVQIACRQCTRGYLGVQQGNSAPTLYDVNIDAGYIAAVCERIMEFHRSVTDGEPPVPAPPAPVLPSQWRSINLDQLPLANWGHALKPTLNLWRDTREVHAMHEQAKSDVKTLLPDDVGTVTYGTITIKRARNGAVTIREVA